MWRTTADLLKLDQNFIANYLLRWQNLQMYAITLPSQAPASTHEFHLGPIDGLLETHLHAQTFPITVDENSTTKRLVEG